MNAIAVAKEKCDFCGRFQELNEARMCFWCENKGKLSRKANLRPRTSNPFYYDGTSRFVSLSQLHQDTLLLIGKLPPDVVAIVGVARSGMAVASIAAMMLHLPLFTIRQTLGDVVSCGNGWRLGHSTIDIPKGKVAVIDDTVMTGNSLRAIKPIVEKHFGNVVTATVYCNPKSHVKPDIFARELAWPHLLEWNLFNSVLSPNMACDFDGILCRDCPPGSDDDGPRYLEFINNATPLYTPRRCPIPLIVTARIEKYREPTINWLRRHRINFNRLIMHPANTLAERNKDSMAAFKARHYLAWSNTHRPHPAPNGFIESDDRQAREISRISGLLTICPATASTYSKW